MFPFIVGRGPVPRHASGYPTFAGDRPPRYGTGRVSSRSRGTGPRATVSDVFLGSSTAPHRRARACPSPCCDLPEVRGGNPLGCACGIRGPPRYGIGRVSSRSRGTGPRATVLGGFLGSSTAPLHRRARACPSPCFGLPNDRGGQAPALRY